MSKPVSEAFGVLDELVPCAVVEQASADGHVPAVVPDTKVLLPVHVVLFLALALALAVLFGWSLRVDVEQRLAAYFALDRKEGISTGQKNGAAPQRHARCILRRFA